MNDPTQFRDQAGRDLTLTDAQIAWCEQYIGRAKFNASEAARLVGLTADYGRQLRALPHVMAYVAQLQADQLDDWKVSQQRTIAEIAAIAYSDITDLVQVTDQGNVLVRSLEDLPKSVRVAIKKIKLRRVGVRRITKRKDGNDGDDTAAFDEILELEFHDKLEALRLLGQWQGIFKPEDAGKTGEPWTGFNVVAPDDPPGDGAAAAAERE